MCRLCYFGYRMTRAIGSAIVRGAAGALRAMIGPAGGEALDYYARVVERKGSTVLVRIHASVNVKFFCEILLTSL